MGLSVMIWGIFMHVKFLYNIWEFLQFFSELCDIWGALGRPQGSWGGPPNGVPRLGIFQYQFEYSTFLEYLRIIILT